MKASNAIQCYQCGTRVTLADLVSNQDNCPECGAAHALKDVAQAVVKESLTAEQHDWRAHSVNYAKGEKCPETIETLQAAWGRDQELIDDMRHEIARHKTRINRLEQTRNRKPDAELVELLAMLRKMVNATPLNDIDRGGVWFSTKHPLIKRIDAKLASLSTASKPAFSIGDRVQKKSGSEWAGVVVGTYSTTLTPEGYAVESENHAGSVQIYPVGALVRGDL